MVGGGICGGVVGWKGRAAVLLGHGLGSRAALPEEVRSLVLRRSMKSRFALADTWARVSDGEHGGVGWQKHFAVCRVKLLCVEGVRMLADVSGGPGVRGARRARRESIQRERERAAPICAWHARPAPVRSISLRPSGPKRSHAE